MVIKLRYGFQRVVSFLRLTPTFVRGQRSFRDTAITVNKHINPVRRNPKNSRSMFFASKILSLTDNLPYGVIWYHFITVDFWSLLSRILWIMSSDFRKRWTHRSTTPRPSPQSTSRQRCGIWGSPWLGRRRPQIHKTEPSASSKRRKWSGEGSRGASRRLTTQTSGRPTKSGSRSSGRNQQSLQFGEEWPSLPRVV